MTRFIATPQGRRIAYDRIEGEGLGVVFLHGLKSDMRGGKAEALAQWARTTGRPFLRFDCSGHGESDGQFEEGTIGRWVEDARAVIGALTQGPQILVGSSMGGWLALLLARDTPEMAAALVTVAGAPDFTEDGYWAEFSQDERAALVSVGYVDMPSDYAEPYRITRALIEDGRRQLVLRSALDLPMPVRLLQGAEDSVVTPETALKLFHHASGDDIRLTLAKGADHGFSRPEDIALITATLEGLRTSPYAALAEAAL